MSRSEIDYQTTPVWPPYLTETGGLIVLEGPILPDGELLESHMYEPEPLRRPLDSPYSRAA